MIHEHVADRLHVRALHVVRHGLAALREGVRRHGPDLRRRHQVAEVLVVTNYTAAWCGPCQAAAPVFDKMSEDHDGVIFCKVDIDDEDLGDLVAAAQVRAVPTYTFTKGGETVADNVQGADMEAIRDVLASQ